MAKRRWSGHEQEILRRNSAAQCHKLLPHRTPSAIKQQQRKVKCPAPKPASDFPMPWVCPVRCRDALAKQQQVRK